MPRKDAHKGKHGAAVERRVQAFELHKVGVPYREIGAQLGVSGKTAHEDVQSVLDELRAMARTSANDYVLVELERLDAAQFALSQHLDSGDPQIINSWVKVSESRRKLLGLDAPQKIAPVNPDGTPYHAYTELRTVILALLPAEARIALADQLDRVIDATAADRPTDEP